MCVFAIECGSHPVTPLLVPAVLVLVVFSYALSSIADLAPVLTTIVVVVVPVVLVVVVVVIIVVVVVIIVIIVVVIIRTSSRAFVLQPHPLLALDLAVHAATELKSNQLCHALQHAATHPCSRRVEQANHKYNMRYGR